METAFESWAFVELMGHLQIAGKCLEQTIAGAAFLRVDVPKTRTRDQYTKYYSASAIYSITPCSEEVAQQAAERLAVSAIPVHIVQIPALTEKVFRPTAGANPDFDDDDEHDDAPAYEDNPNHNDDDSWF